MNTTRLGADAISRRFGPLQALTDVSFAARERTIHALLGENGAGKTTLIRSLSGLDRPDSGSVVVRGEPARFCGPKDAFDAGIAVVQQELALSPDLTVLENLVLGNEPSRYGRVDWTQARERAEEIAESIGARIPWQRRVGDLEVGTQQQLEIVRSLYRGADTLILDEPSAALAPSQIDGLLRLLVGLREQGNTVIIITHKLEEALRVADDVTVLRGGRVVESKPVEGLDRAELSRMIVGEDVRQVRTPRTTPVGENALEVHAMTVPGRQLPVGPVSFGLHAGEVLGLAGVAGNGQEDLIEALIGLRPCTGGSLLLAGADITSASVQQRRKLGIGYISADRRHEGLSVHEPLVQNVVMGRHRFPPIARHGWMSPRRAHTYATDVLNRYGVRFGRASDPASSLSGGNQQKIVFGREMTAAPRVILAAQPTRGVDVRGIQELQEHLMRARDDGAAILLMSQELDELLALSDRVLVMYHGTATEPIDPTRPDAREQIGRAMIGEPTAPVTRAERDA